MIAKVLRALVSVALFAGGMALGCAAIGLVLPVPNVPQVKEKIDWFRAHRGEYTALFLGTSRVRRHIIPSLFDRLAAERGMEMRSFNLGVDTLMAPEDGYVLDLALAARPPKLRYVFIELSFFRANFLGQAPDTIRAAYWHDCERTRTVWCHLIDNDLRNIKPLRKRKENRWSTWLADIGEWASLVTEHGRLFLERGTNFGRVAVLWPAVAGLRSPSHPLAPLGPGLDGFIPSPADTVVRGDAVAAYEQEISKLKSGGPRERPLDPVPEANLERMCERIRRHGAEPILLIAPSQSGYTSRPRREVAPVLDFSDPQQWPELFDVRYRADAGHLNTAGAEIFTRALAGKFYALLPLGNSGR
ncbi:MAG TPA: hypothetical protein VEO95_09115 [Chthoniobacteraceae bacterium]|nr:hypothetical protein [Chthoniobacteraceae bacterium]